MASVDDLTVGITRYIPVVFQRWLQKLKTTVNNIEDTIDSNITEYTTASGEITITDTKKIRYITISIENGATTGNLTKINGGHSGELLIMEVKTGTDELTVKDSEDIVLQEIDFPLTGKNKLTCICHGPSKWHELARAANGS